jgi:hypothetical protein
MFGAGLPILYPIAWLSFILFNLIERLLVTYSYREPPLFDQTLHRDALRLIKFAPLIYCAVAFWMFGNPQIFGTDVYYLRRYSQHQVTNHTLSSALDNLDYHNEPLLILFGFLMITNFVSKLVYKVTFKDSTTIDMGSEKNEDVQFINVLGQL